MARSDILRLAFLYFTLQAALGFRLLRQTSNCAITPEDVCNNNPVGLYCNPCDQSRLFSCIPGIPPAEHSCPAGQSFHPIVRQCMDASEVAVECTIGLDLQLETTQLTGSSQVDPNVAYQQDASLDPDIQSLTDQLNALLDPNHALQDEYDYLEALINGSADATAGLELISEEEANEEKELLDYLLDPEEAYADEDADEATLLAQAAAAAGVTLDGTPSSSQAPYRAAESITITLADGQMFPEAMDNPVSEDPNTPAPEYIANIAPDLSEYNGGLVSSAPTLSVADSAAIDSANEAAFIEALDKELAEYYSMNQGPREGETEDPLFSTSQTDSNQILGATDPTTYSSSYSTLSEAASSSYSTSSSSSSVDPVATATNAEFLAAVEAELAQLEANYDYSTDASEGAATQQLFIATLENPAVEQSQQESAPAPRAFGVLSPRAMNKLRGSILKLPQALRGNTA